MAKRKYTRFGEEAVAYECSKRKCKWQGSEAGWVQKRADPKDNISEATCPNCGNKEFYGLLHPLTTPGK